MKVGGYVFAAVNVVPVSQNVQHRSRVGKPNHTAFRCLGIDWVSCIDYHHCWRLRWGSRLVYVHDNEYLVGIQVLFFVFRRRNCESASWQNSVKSTSSGIAYPSARWKCRHVSGGRRGDACDHRLSRKPPMA